MDGKVIAIGHEDIKNMMEKNLYYVDKTLMIKELLDAPSKVTLFTRPRRFGKTLNLSMIRRFFEDERTEDGKKIDNRHVFEELAISKSGEAYLNHQQQYPVINLSLKSAKQPNYRLAYSMLKSEITKEFGRHAYVLSAGIISENDCRQYRAIMESRDEETLYANALEFLSECLARYHKKNVIILIDEYDVPLENAYFEGFYDQMIAFIRSLFESALKTNPALEFAVITGCLRISRESIFTGLNNLDIQSILSPAFSTSFGFTEEEVRTMLHYYDLEDKFDELKTWYDGYRFGETEIYNPWSIINYVKTAIINHDALPEAYWSNTSSNSIVKELIEEAGMETREELEQLIEGHTIEKPIHEDITYGDIHESMDNLWNFLFFTGYLKAGERRKEGEQTYIDLTIPNLEIRSVYKRSIRTWFEKQVDKTDRSALVKALEKGDCERIEAFISDQLLSTISTFDYAESYYHGFLSGLLRGNGKFLVLSNRESGTGRPDMILRTPSVRGMAVVLELKIAAAFDQMEKKCQEALAQIEEKDYEADLRKQGYAKIRSYGICFYRKECIVMEKAHQN